MGDLYTILIVDDSADMRRAITLMIRDLVGEIYECGDGAEACTAYAAHLPDWVLMDIRMKKTDGLTATRQLKAAFPDARVVIVTVCKGDDIRDAARSAGAVAYIMKDNLLELRQFLLDQAINQEAKSLAR